ncbi:bifunctional riboflavin kinase/FAD synthetase [Brevibacillus ruminantium]|uniref:Riboflavin biosynthesis protein n=1 Tax=Brevibacillus ruminantium TaxID=2950604 RepID=A0ABY4WTQ0_9BACL|nr:bifunctional riboflavin kinase/FAD synthetase [Brevibacillus ruminantium]USG67976.1 bifunctional riboflavin kinase/FAD synthetase [Brevibacillus ruminantium]
MKKISLTYPLPKDLDTVPCAIALGYFDGVHIGHRRVIQKAIDTAKANGWKSAVMTFDPHPREVLGQTGYTQYLTPLPEKLEQLEKMGVDLTYIVRFDISFAAVYPEDFIEECLLPLECRHVVVGFDYTFGYRGMGTAQTLQELSRGRYGVDVIGPVNRLGEKVSSTVIREYLHHGDVEQTRHLLGRSYKITGEVVHGDKRGRTIGFPTANVRVTSPFLIGKNGVYGVRINVEGEVYQGVMNVGIKPTFELEKKEKSLEVHIFDFAREIYGKEVDVELLFFIRDEQKFSGVEALIAQIQKDVQVAKRKFAEGTA